MAFIYLAGKLTKYDLQAAAQSRSRSWWRNFVDTLDIHDLECEPSRLLSGFFLSLLSGVHTDAPGVPWLAYIVTLAVSLKEHKLLSNPLCSCTTALGGFLLLLLPLQLFSLLPEFTLLPVMSGPCTCFGHVFRK